MAELSCMTCELMLRRERGEAPMWDSILRTEHWDLVHSFESTLLGWLVLIVRRHIEAVADLTDAEAASLGPLVRDLGRPETERVPEADRDRLAHALRSVLIRR